MADVRGLDDNATLSFLHDTVSDRHHAVIAPETPMYLDGVLADTPLVGGLEPRLVTFTSARSLFSAFRASAGRASSMPSITRTSAIAGSRASSRSTRRSRQRP